MNAFHHWLRSAELFEIRAAISAVHGSETAARLDHAESKPLQTTVFLTCHPLELARFPWEAWEIGAEFATRSAIRMIRTPATIQAASAIQKPRGKARILSKEVPPLYHDFPSVVRSICFHIHLVLDNLVMNGFSSSCTHPLRTVQSVDTLL